MKIEDKKNKKVAFLIRNFDASGGGAERFCVELAIGLSKEYQVSVFTQNIKTEIPAIKFYLIPQKIKRPRFLNQFFFGRKVKKLLKNLNFNIIHSHDTVPGANFYTIHVPCFKSFITESNGIKKVFLVFSLILSPRKLTYLWMESKVYSQENIILPVSNLLAKNIKRNYPKAKISNITYPGIWPHNQNYIENQIRESMQIPLDAFLILFVGHSFERKGLITLIKALEYLSIPDIYLLVAGDGNRSAITFENDIVKNNTKFLGRVEDMDKIYCAGNILVHPSIGDTFGMVVLEAMSHGLPVVVSNKIYCGISETLNEKNAFLLSNPRNAAEISKIILKIFKNKSLEKAMSENAKKHSLALTWDKTVINTVKAYNSA